MSLSRLVLTLKYHLHVSVEPCIVLCSFALLARFFISFLITLCWGTSSYWWHFWFSVWDFYSLDVLVFVPINNQRSFKEHVPVECKNSGTTSQGRMYCCSHGMHSNWQSFIDVFLGASHVLRWSPMWLYVLRIFPKDFLALVHTSLMWQLCNNVWKFFLEFFMVRLGRRYIFWIELIGLHALIRIHIPCHWIYFSGKSHS